MARSHRPAYADIDVESAYSSSSVDSDDSWYTRDHHLRVPVRVHYGRHNGSPHRSHHGQRDRVSVVFPPAPPPVPVPPVFVEQPRGRPVQGRSQRARSVDRYYERDIFLGGRSTVPNLHVDIHNRNSDDHDHSHRSEYEHGVGYGAWGYPQPAPAPVLYAPGYTPGISPAYSPSVVSDTRARVNDRMSLDHGEVMNQQVWVDGRPQDPYGRRHRHHYDDGFLDPINLEITNIQKTAVDDYVHQQRLADDAKNSAVRQAKLDWKDHVAEIDDARDKGVRKYKDDLSERKKAGEEAVFTYKKDQADKKAELDTAKKKWEIDKAQEEQEEKNKKKQWEVDQAKKKQEKEEEEKRLKDAWKAAEEKKKKEDKEKEDKLKAEVEKELLKAGFGPRTVEGALDPKKAPPRISNEWAYAGGSYRGYSAFEPWEEGGRRWIRVHRRYVMPDTLNVYDLPWEWDHVSVACNSADCSQLKTNIL